MYQDSLIHTLHTDYAVPSKSLRPLLDALKAEMAASDPSKAWNGSSEDLKKYLVDTKLDPKANSKYQHFFVNKRHTAAVSYTWRGTNVYDIAAKAELPELRRTLYGLMCWLSTNSAYLHLNK